MPGPEPKTPARAGISDDDQVDVAALVARLREELTGRGDGAEADRGRLLAAREQAERMWERKRHKDRSRTPRAPPRPAILPDTSRRGSPSAHSLIQRVGLPDERFGIGMFEDDDYAWRVRALGYRLVCAEDVFVHHFGRSSIKDLEAAAYDALFERNKQLFERKWHTVWERHRFQPRARREP